MFRLIRTLLAFVWSALSCLTALSLALLSKRLTRFVLTQIGSKMWSANILRIAGINRPHVTFSSPNARFEEWPQEVILVCNHASQLDINVCANVIPRPIVYLAKQSIRKVPILGLLNERVGTVFIDRKNPKAAKRSVENLMASLSKGISVIVYPEGTRSPDGELLRFKKGAFFLAADADIPVIPMHVHGTRTVLAKGKFLLTPNPVHVRFGELQHPSGKSQEEISTLAEDCFAEVNKMRTWHQSQVTTPD